MAKYNLSAIMNNAHKIAKNAAKKFGGTSRLYFKLALKIAWQTAKENIEMAAKTTKFIVTDKRGYSYRLRHLESNQVYRAQAKEFSFVIGSLLEVEIDFTKVIGDGLDPSNFKVVKQTFGDSLKKRVKIQVDQYKVGDIFEGVPILSIGQSFAEKGKAVAYAYFK